MEKAISGPDTDGEKTTRKATHMLSSDEGNTLLKYVVGYV